MMFRRPSGSDRSPRRKGVQPAKPAAVFCERWHDGEHRPSGVINLGYSFTRVDAKTLFLEQIILWEYHEDADRDLNTATKSPP
jgi:hypothetical protein